jgi:2-C-methyl-D-erythritol 4-phosphate cytidylyltransferase/2-C-methyl-D-erythritol 2,4-cyclodiphosphate synthase
MHRVAAIIPAGGRGVRFGADAPKQLLAVGGRAILDRTVSAFVEHPAVSEIVVALPQELVETPPAYLRNRAKPITIVAGGERRQDSVANAFAAASPAADVILVHDAARPFVSAGLIDRTIAAAARDGAALAALPAHDTVKQAERGVVLTTLPRESIFLAQTPQAFRRDIAQAILSSGEDATDEAMLAERAGHAVTIVAGEATNIKITAPEDLALAETIAARGRGAVGQAAAVVARAGTGYDLHRLVAGRPLIIGGVTVPFDKGPLGHSDGDVVCHAVTDAVLGAAALGDIGRHFPDTDPRWKGASSLDLLARAAALLSEAGFAVLNADCTVVLQAPKIKDHIEAMRANVARALGVEQSQVSVKGKTNEGVDAVGRGEAIAAHAIATIISTQRSVTIN